jgi:hypothetical protein
VSAVGQQVEVVALHGEVVDKSSGQGIVGASVEVIGQKIVSFTDANGRFVLPRVRVGGAAVRVRLLGYSDVVFSRNIAAGDSPMRIELVPNPVVMQALEVVADRFETRRKSAGFSVRPYTAEQIVESASFDIYEFLKDRIGFVRCPDGSQPFAAVQGAAIVGHSETCIRWRGGWVAPQVFVDDALWLGGVETLQGWSKADIHRVEVMRRGVQIAIFTHGFAERLAKGQAQLQPHIIVR